MIELPDDGFMVAWSIRYNPVAQGVAPGPALSVGPHPDVTGWSSHYMYTTGCCDAHFMDLSRDEQAQALLNLAAALMFEGIPPADVLWEFAKVSLWRDMSVMLPQARAERAFLSDDISWNPHNP